MRVTVITVCLDAASTLAATIESVLHAGSSVHEYLIVDGGSTDGTVDVIKRLEPRFQGRLRWVSEPDDGLYFAMNRGLEMAHDSFILFLGADDSLLPGSLDRVAETLGSAAGVDLVYGDVRILESDGTTRVERGCEPPGSSAAFRGRCRRVTRRACSPLLHIAGLAGSTPRSESPVTTSSTCAFARQVFQPSMLRW